MKKKLSVLLAAAVCFGMYGSSLSAGTPPAAVEKKAEVCRIVENNRAKAEIVLPFFRLLNETEEYAAEELQKWIGSMTGAYVPVRIDHSVTETPYVSGKPLSDVKVRIFIGASFARKLFPVPLSPTKA